MSAHATLLPPLLELELLGGTSNHQPVTTRNAESPHFASPRSPRGAENVPCIEKRVVCLELSSLALLFVALKPSR
ncbi:hypothetical protein JTE90_007650 [Oedothorax gibbosus]|uniref:Uncharacterized protein n=1 Tax=Oedothorax gibbosus TaxID=931172 RepID=A0AAV6ULV7_9ARAC|nr:hypothetical protein JTE90_007650 [Oedothorax gibbosus]